ncbi:PASTA domain-containing protein, partial [Streptomyces sp. 3N207]|uniref:PASTA domain-containing protein n=1 Tax=Streptomyces sp. 3N207 TaxID=3457417 RepID=UPI003FD368DC
PPTQTSPAAGPATTPGYGYPQSPHGGTSTPPPYTIGAHGSGPGNGGSGKKLSTGAMAGYGLAAVAVIVALVFVIIGLTSGDDDPDPKPTAKPKPTPTAEKGGTGGDDGGDDSGGFKGPDKTKTVETDKCTDATDSYSEKGKVLMPDLTQKDLTSVKACLRAAGWKLGEVTREDENVWGKDIVMDQSPGSIEEFDPKKDKVDLTVSTGQPAD